MPRRTTRSDQDLRLRILGCGDGPASFNAGATRIGAHLISCDPIYRYEAAEIRDRIAATYDHLLEQTRRNADEFVWTAIRSVEELGELRTAAMNEFLDDFPAGEAEGRYIDAELLRLGGERSPFVDENVDELRFGL